MSTSTHSADRSDREAVLDRLAETIEATHQRIDPAEATSPDEQKLQIKWIRTLGYLSGQYRKLLNDEELDEMAAELELLHDDGGHDE
ncbi:hypothetical protein [Natrarchaeobius chitinivorans]|uniref:DUF8136 domain-containing protein n=1 Tax=Natrarchaeobius chitinivorans TaxID=1679083 RepID=A0A3N6M2L5_NATCH|nr:hypothetical protein [Natrarchaeobius chitinivorans]RQG97653.1 hypothetical protein EA473_00020 [Natrarchaeobius chitinivorans]